MWWRKRKSDMHIEEWRRLITNAINYIRHSRPQMSRVRGPADTVNISGGFSTNQKLQFASSDIHFDEKTRIQKINVCVDLPMINALFQTPYQVFIVREVLWQSRRRVSSVHWALPGHWPECIWATRTSIWTDHFRQVRFPSFSFLPSLPWSDEKFVKTELDSIANLCSTFSSSDSFFTVVRLLHTSRNDTQWGPMFDSQSVPSSGQKST